MSRPHRIVLRRAIPSVVLRIALGVVVAGGGALLNPVLGWQLAAAAVGVLAAALPATRLSYLGVALVVLGMLITGPDPWRTAIALLVVHAIHALTSIVAIVPARARVSLRALRPLAERFAVLQLAAQAVALAVALLPAAEAPWLAPIGALALAGAAAVFLLRPGHGDDGD